MKKLCFTQLRQKNNKQQFVYQNRIQQYIQIQMTLNGRLSSCSSLKTLNITTCTRVGTLIVATIYLQLIQNRYMFRSFTVLQCSHQHCLQPVASDVEVVGYL